MARPNASGHAITTAEIAKVNAVRKGARHSILIKDAATLEGVSRVQIVVLDKTGTLTEGKPSVTDVRPVGGVSADDLLRKAAAVSAFSTHPLSQAAVRAATERSLPIPQATDIENVAGAGVRGKIDGVVTLIGSARLLEQSGVEPG